MSDERDRRAVETIIGRELPQTWPQDAWPAGTPVRVVHARTWSGPWRDVFTGTVSAMAAPRVVERVDAHDGELEYWVDFDAPQFDADGDGPYRRAVIWTRYLERLETDAGRRRT